METRRFWYYGKYPLFGILGIAALAGFTFVVMWLWNWLVPELFKGPELTYWQSLGLLVLSKILFSGIGGKGHDDHGRDQKHWSHSRDKWRSKFQQKMNGIAEEKKEKSESSEGD